jgi:NAD(P)-dependent dehydrogenase (short-subunit alcohol dehydrogenase family)
MKVDLSSKAAVVTGGGGVLGRYFARALADSGAKVALLGRRAHVTQKVADEITASGGQAISIGCDVLNQDDVSNAEKTIYEKFGQYHILVKIGRAHV